MERRLNLDFCNLRSCNWPIALLLIFSWLGQDFCFLRSTSSWKSASPAPPSYIMANQQHCRITFRLSAAKIRSQDIKFPPAKFKVGMKISKSACISFDRCWSFFVEVLRNNKRRECSIYHGNHGQCQLLTPPASHDKWSPSFEMEIMTITKHGKNNNDNFKWK